MMGQLGDAVKGFTEAIKLNPDLAEAYFRRGICFFEMDEADLALADFKNASSLAYQDPRSRLWEGFTEAKLKNYYEAIRAYGEAIAESNRYTPAYVNRGLAYMMVGDYTKALADFNDAIRIEPTESDHYFKRGVGLREVEQEPGSGRLVYYRDQVQRQERGGLSSRGDGAGGAGTQRSGDRVPRQGGCDCAADSADDEVSRGWIA